jgi:predicted CopG family antitoxin
MSSRKNLKIDSDVYDRLADAKGSTDTWDEFLSRLLNSVDQDQVHLDRSTLEDFGDEESDIKLQASPTGELEIEFLDEKGSKISGSMLSALDANEEVLLRVRKGEKKNG